MQCEKAYIIHQRWLSEKQLIVCCFGEKTGRFDCTTSRKNTPQIGCCYKLRWKEHRSGLHKLQNKEVQGPIYHFRDNHLITLLYLHELILSLLPLHISYPEAFLQYGKSLALLNNKKCHSFICRYFEQTVISQLGYGLNLDNLPQKKHGWITFNINEGFQWHQDNTPGSYCLQRIHRILSHTMTFDDIRCAKKLLHGIIDEMTHGRKWYSKKIYAYEKNE